MLPSSEPLQVDFSAKQKKNASKTAANAPLVGEQFFWTAQMVHERLLDAIAVHNGTRRNSFETNAVASELVGDDESTEIATTRAVKARISHPALEKWDEAADEDSSEVAAEIDDQGATGWRLDGVATPDTETESDPEFIAGFQVRVVGTARAMAAWRQEQEDELRDVKLRLRAREPAEFARMCADAESLVLKDRFEASAEMRADEALSWIAKPCSNRADEVARRLTIRWLRGDRPFLQQEPLEFEMIDGAPQSQAYRKRNISVADAVAAWESGASRSVSSGLGDVPSELVWRTCSRIARELGAIIDPKPFKPPHRPKLLYSVEDIADHIGHTVKTTKRKIANGVIPVGTYFGWTVAYRDNLSKFKEYNYVRRGNRVQQELRNAA
jgi:hypothetical protein